MSGDYIRRAIRIARLRLVSLGIVDVRLRLRIEPQFAPQLVTSVRDVDQHCRLRAYGNLAMQVVVLAALDCGDEVREVRHRLITSINSVHALAGFPFLTQEDAES